MAPITRAPRPEPDRAAVIEQVRDLLLAAAPAAPRAMAKEDEALQRILWLLRRIDQRLSRLER